jgi:hypothetical protein
MQAGDVPRYDRLTDDLLRYSARKRPSDTMLAAEEAVGVGKPIKRLRGTSRWAVVCLPACLVGYAVRIACLLLAGAGAAADAASLCGAQPAATSSRPALPLPTCRYSRQAPCHHPPRLPLPWPPAHPAGASTAAATGTACASAGGS